MDISKLEKEKISSSRGKKFPPKNWGDDKTAYYDERII